MFLLFPEPIQEISDIIKMEQGTRQDPLNLFLYVGVLFSLLLAIKFEYIDLYSYSDAKILAKRGQSASFKEGQVNDNDDIPTILQKIRITARHDLATVYWRRCLIVAILIAIILPLILLRRLPTAAELVIGVLVVYLIVYLLCVFYQSQVSQPAVERVVQATKLLSDKYKS